MKKLTGKNIGQVVSLSKRFPIVQLGQFGTKEALVPIEPDFEKKALIQESNLILSKITSNMTSNWAILVGSQSGTVVVECTSDAADILDMGKTIRFKHYWQDKVIYIYSCKTDFDLAGTAEFEDGISVCNYKFIPIFDQKCQDLFLGCEEDEDNDGWKSTEVGEMPLWMIEKIKSAPVTKFSDLFIEKPNHRQLAVRFLDKYPNTVYGLNKFWRYDGKTYSEIAEFEIKKEILGVVAECEPLGVKTTHYLLISVLEIIKTLCTRSNTEFNGNPNLIALENGVFDLVSWMLIPHSPDYLITIRLPFSYDGKKKCENWVNYIDSVQRMNHMFLQEFAGYCLTSDTRLETAIWLYGVPGSGKSTFLEGLHILLGDSTGILGLAEIEHSRFALANVPNKKLLISSEQPCCFVSTSHILNALISGETITIERKFSDVMEIRPHAKIAWSMNDLPKIRSNNDGIFRRVKIIKFEKLDDSVKDIYLKDKIRNEVAGIFNWALEGLKRLRENDKFTITQKILDDTRAFQEENDVIQIFIEESCETGEGFRYKSSDLYRLYFEWCSENGHKAVPSTQFKNELDLKGIKNIKKSGEKVYIGIKSK
jgi:P4 family phage/plasmid primase-like protien